MATATETDRSPVPTPLFAVVGATNLAVERVRAVVAGVPAVQAQLAPQALTAKAQELPTKAAARALEVASIGQARYEELAVRGKTIIDSIRSQAATRQLIDQAGNTVSRGKAAITTARKAADDTYAAILGTLGVGRAEAEDVVITTRTAAKTAVKTATKTAAKKTQTATAKTQTSAKKTATTASKNAAATKSAVKGARTSATKTASAASKAASDAAGKIAK